MDDAKFGMKIRGLEQLAEVREQLPVQRKQKRPTAQNEYERTINTLLTLWQQCVENYEQLPRELQNVTRTATRQMRRYRKTPKDGSKT